MSDSILDTDAVALLRRTKCAEFTDDQFAEFLHAVNRFQLDPFGNQIYGRLQMSYGRKSLVIITGIDGYRLIADRSGKYAGSTDAEFDDEEQPRRATVTVAKLVGGTTGYFSASARWDQYYPGDKAGMMWKKMPHLMLAKCLPRFAKIQTDRGRLAIGDIVRQTLPVKVRSLDGAGRVVWADVIGNFRNGGTDDWVAVRAHTGEQRCHPHYCTPDHEILAESGWTAAANLKPGDKVAVSAKVLSREQRSMVTGTLLGDASLAGRCCQHLVFTHSAKQAAWAHWKSRQLVSVGVDVTNRTSSDGRNTHDVVTCRTPAMPTFDEFRSLYANGTKEPTIEALRCLGALGVAVWIMDDGAIRADTRCNARPTIQIATCAFEDQAAIVAFFEREFNLSPSIRRPARNPYLQFGVDETESLLDSLRSYLTWDRSNNAKRWVGGDIPQGYDGIAFMPVLSVRPHRFRERMGRYCLQTEHGNFLYRNLVVHNCAEALALRKAFPAELSGIYTREEMQQADQDDKMLTGESVKRPREKAVPKQTLDAAMEEATLPAGREDDYAMLSTYIDDAASETRLDQIAKLAAGFRWSEATATKLADAIEQRRVDLLNLAAQEGDE